MSDTCISFQKHPFYGGNLHSETPVDSNNALLHWAGVLCLQRLMLAVINRFELSARIST